MIEIKQVTVRTREIYLSDPTVPVHRDPVAVSDRTNNSGLSHLTSDTTCEANKLYASRFTGETRQTYAKVFLLRSGRLFNNGWREIIEHARFLREFRLFVFPSVQFLSIMSECDKVRLVDLNLI